MVRNDEKKSYSLFKFWAELAVFGCAEKWADSYSTVNFDNGFWLIQKSDCSKNKLKNPRILWSNLFVIGVLGYNQLLKTEFFSLFTSLWLLLQLSYVLQAYFNGHKCCIGEVLRCVSIICLILSRIHFQNVFQTIVQSAPAVVYNTLRYLVFYL